MIINNSDNQHINLRSYILCLVGYMTLTLSLSLVPYIAIALKLSTTEVLQALSFLFLSYSLSAILLASASDVLGSSKVLTIAQCISMLGLLLITIAQNELMLYLGFLLTGIGTGPYASIARAFISRYASNNIELKKAYALLSISLVIAPLLSAFIAQIALLGTWRLAYLMMFMIELSVFWLMRSMLQRDKTTQQLISWQKILHNFVYIFRVKTYLLNLPVLSLCFAFYIQVIMTNIKPLLTTDLGISIISYNIILVLITSCYIVGILCFRRLAHLSHRAQYRISALCFFAVMTVLFGLLPFTILNTLICITLLCFCAGFFVPLSTGSAMQHIQKAHGSAAATISFAVTFTISIWTYVQAHSHFSTYHFILFALWVTLVASSLLSIIILNVKNTTMPTA
ncbi:MFS transporter [Cysteiniphilum sp. QT6929]|uniref:MFS transporter n=1 Tax=Cysteiniphilum sp. QT6929 TaxID=2975055 RepID=UPI0024B34920|nr:MFS transporter [Cysteiniphilum sp. QT6929]WHN65627.1 MFS transporter [Cysteiniphilum sp. QT6929]